ncbi:MAG: flagellar assembly protein A [Pseudomonadota bacterium]
MTEKRKPIVIILESDESILEQARSALAKSGWDVICEKTSIEALNRVSQSKKSPFALFITNSKLPKMEGDEILEKVKSLSPLTQRMIMLPSDNPDILINAINKAKVNACITIPFNDEDLIALAKDCFKKFKHAFKKEQLKRITGHQNRQMLITAQKLKKKDDTYKHLIDEKNVRILKLKSKKRKLESQHRLDTQISLPDLVSHKGIHQAPEAFKSEFIFLCNLIKKEFSSLIKTNRIDPETFNVEKLFNPSTQNKNDISAPESAPDSDIDPKEDQTSATDQSSVKDTQAPADKNDLPEPKELPPSSLIQEILNKTLTIAMAAPKTISAQQSNTIDTNNAIVLEEDDEKDEIVNSEISHVLDTYYKITISEDQVQAHIRKRKAPDSNSSQHTSAEILELLKHKQVFAGIIDDQAIDTWLAQSTMEKILIAQGKAAEHGENGKVFFHFETKFTNPGKVNADGTIDFKDRGKTPFVSTGTLLAQKKPAREGKPGICVSSTPIPVEEVEDPAFVAGPGTQLSDDGLSIHAAIDGQPHLDKLGIISVNADLVIPEDVDYKTGNIDFHGNIIVKGMIKEGFKVKGINLTVQEIEGGIIDISGDLNVSAGITEATISAQGNIYAKFISRSKIMGFGDLTVSKEILDSSIIISGKCINESGHIIASKISAKLGISAGKIGTQASKSSTLKVGIDEHVNILKEQIKAALESSVTKSKLLQDEIKKLEDEDQALYKDISEKAQIQDQAQLAIKEMLKELKILKDANDTAQTPLVIDEIKKFKETAEKAEKDLSTIFETQDRIAGNIEKLRHQLTVLEEKNKTHVQEKKAIKAFAQKENPIPVVTIAKTIIQDNVIIGPHSSITLSEDKSRCKIQELGSQETGINLYEMTVCDI